LNTGVSYTSVNLYVVWYITGSLNELNKNVYKYISLYNILVFVNF